MSRARIKGDTTPSAWGKSRRFKNCCYCEVPIPIEKVTREHIIPKRLGGRVTKPCCFSCNQQKGGLELADWLIVLMGGPIVGRTRLKIRNGLIYLKLLYPGQYDHI